jgi:hypothetical protein
MPSPTASPGLSGRKPTAWSSASTAASPSTSTACRKTVPPTIAALSTMPNAMPISTPSSPTTIAPACDPSITTRRRAPRQTRGTQHLRRGRLYVNHYSFHILDPEWGHLTIKISGHPPFPAQVILNGHEYVARQARKAAITFTKEGNCFTAISDAAGLAKIAENLCEQRAIGRLSQVCERWIYTCVCFALDFDEQKRSGFHYQYSNYQIEYSRNLVFEVGGHMEQVFQALIDRSRAPLDLKTIKTILG